MARPLKQVAPRFQYGIACTAIALLEVICTPAVHLRNNASWDFTLNKGRADNPELRWIP